MSGLHLALSRVTTACGIAEQAGDAAALRPSTNLSPHVRCILSDGITVSMHQRRRTILITASKAAAAAPAAGPAAVPAAGSCTTRQLRAMLLLLRRLLLLLLLISA